MSKRRKQKKIPFEELRKKLIEKISSTDNEVLVCRCYEIAFEALTEVDKMFKKEYILSEKVTLVITDSQTTFAEGCGINYKIK